MTLTQLKQELNQHKNPSRAKLSQGYFKTGKGHYGEGDVFLGLTVPQQRAIAKKYLDLSLADLAKLLASKIHEYRFTGLVILVSKYKRGSEPIKRQIYNFYLQHAKRVNNWDLVDTSAPSIVGEYLADKNKAILYRLARSQNLWEKRIAVLATFAFIKRDNFSDALQIGELLLHDSHDLIHKAVGWMLREVGKRDFYTEKKFLDKHARRMPRTMLRYAIERLPKTRQAHYLTHR